MQALVKYGYGKGETQLREVPLPEIGPDDLLIEVRAAGICGSDLAYDNGEHPEHLNPPVILGHEFAGVIAEAGIHAAAEWKVGERVVSDNTGYVCGQCYACATGDFISCPERLGLGYGMDGGFTRFVKISGEVLRRNPKCLFRIPVGVTFEEAAMLDPVCNAYKAIVQESRFMPGEDVVIYGVGPLGLFSIQIAKLAGAANIIAVASSHNNERFHIAKKFGATHIILYDQEDVVAKVKQITKGELVPLVVDCAGPNSVIQESFQLLRKGGTFNRIGYDANPLPFSLDPIINRGITIKGHFGYDFVSWRNCIKLLEAGKLDLQSVITHRYRLDQWQEAFRVARTKEAAKIILTYHE
jgi:2-desacetyl-2-hydroxyethyl bacteriochlorophyllide A dehydrogenase